jgi:antitoxin VapB
VAPPEGKAVVVDPQAFAWNPSVRGGKVEDTVLLRDGAIELLTESIKFPKVVNVVDGVSYHSSGVLLR